MVQGEKMNNRHTALIQKFCDGGPAVRAAVTGYPIDKYDIAVTPGKWSLKELIVHLADSDAIAIDRMKRILTEDNPTLLWANDKAYVERLHSEKQSMEDAVILFEAGRRQFARILECLSDADFCRTGTHNKIGEVTLEGLVNSYINHLNHHLEFAYGKRETLAKNL